jgi:NAD(P)-dependent dehydrogenase (short-subunit alcohol dehydrogenase family)
VQGRHHLVLEDAGTRGGAQGHHGERRLPGTDTPILRGFLGEAKPGRRSTTRQPDDIPGIVAFLASDDAVFITGLVISVSGRLTMAG